MRAAAPVQVTLCRFGLWRVAVCIVAASSVLAVGLWLTQITPAPSVGIHLAAGVMVLAVAGWAWHLLHTSASSLRWDGAIWHHGPLATAGDEPASGKVDVTIDLGAWMLLRFASDTPPHRPCTVWLPVQRAGLEPQWHALRCAVYSPRPPLGAAQKADL